MAIPYDAEKHILLCDQAHRRRIDSETEEYQEYLRRIRDYAYDPFDPSKRLELFEVDLPEWPPVKRTPLQLLMGIGPGGQPIGPFADKPWVGRQWAVENDHFTWNATSRLAKEMSPFSEDHTPEHLSYQWQCARFDPAQHVIIRYWCREHNADIVKFFREFLPAHPDIPIIEVTNPEIDKEEAQGGGYSPTRRAIPVEHLPQVVAYFGPGSPLPPHPRQEQNPLLGLTLLNAATQTTIADLTQGAEVELVNPGGGLAIRADVNPDSRIGSVHFELDGPKVVTRTENIAPYSLYGDQGGRLHGEDLPPGPYNIRVTAYAGKRQSGEMLDVLAIAFTISEAPEEQERTPVPEVQDREEPGPTALPWENTRAYAPSAVLVALRAAVGRRFDLFGGQLSDSRIVAVSEQAMRDFLRADPTDRGVYVGDEGKRNYDCDNFADTLRNALNRKHGLNCIGIIWGDGHAWNFFVVNAGATPKIVFVEPQDDMIVEELSGPYAVKKRCAIYL